MNDIDRLRAALGAAHAGRYPGGIRIAGEAQRHGATCRFTLAFDAAGRSLTRFDGPLAEAVALAGRSGWSVDWTGMPRALELGDLEEEQLAACALTGRWGAPDNPFRLMPAGPSPDGGTITFEVQHATGPLRAQLDVDRDNWLPRSLHTRNAISEEEWTFADYRSFDGLALPGRVTRGCGATLLAVSEVRTVAPLPTDAGELGAAPPAPPDDTVFQDGVWARIDLARGVADHALVRARVGDADSVWFILDTGAGGSTILDPRLRAKLPLERLGAVPVGSVYATALGGVYRGSSLSVGPLRMTAPVFIEMDLAFLAGLYHEPILGIIGYDLLSRCVAEFDLTANVLELHDPARHELHASEWQPLILHRRHPLIPATYEGGRHGLFRMDVGAGGPLATVAFHHHAVASGQLLDGRATSPLRVGTVDVALGKLAWFEIAGHRFEDATVGFALPGDGPFADPYVAGNLGVAFLKPFRIVLDYPRRRMAVTRP
jgi:hypothetical protein